MRRGGRTWVGVGATVALAGVLGLDVLGFSPDFDLDGVEDARDNCPKVANGLREDDQQDEDGDGIGNACECGDLDLDGLVDAQDAALLDACTSPPSPCPGLCDVTGDRLCNGEDVVLLDRFVAGQASKSDFRCEQRGACGNGVHDPGEPCEDGLDPFCCEGCAPRNESRECDPDGIACTVDRCLEGRCQSTRLDDARCEQPEFDCRPHICTTEGCRPSFRPGAECPASAGCCDCPPPGICIPRGPFRRLCDPEGDCVCEDGLAPVPCP